MGTPWAIIDIYCGHVVIIFELPMHAWFSPKRIRNNNKVEHFTFKLYHLSRISKEEIYGCTLEAFILHEVLNEITR